MKFDMFFKFCNSFRFPKFRKCYHKAINTIGTNNRDKNSSIPYSSSLYAIYSLLILSNSHVHCSNDNSVNNSARTYDEILSNNDFNTIIIGGGTAGCTTAYILAKWMDDNNIPGNVLLIEKGVEFACNEGPSTKMHNWYENWCKYAETHESVNRDGSGYPVVPSDHKGLGGCSTHDTRITFKLTPEQRNRMANHMGWSVLQLDSYYQAALNMMPLAPAIPLNESIPFYNAIIDSLTKDNAPLIKIGNDNEYKSEIILNSIGVSSLAMYYHDELRWCTAYYTSKYHKPKKLVVLTDVIVDRILLNKNNINELVATGVNILIDNKVTTIYLNDSNHSNIVLTCGAIGNPALLQRSGIGPKDHLSSLNIPVLIDNPYVGHGIDHEEIAIMYEWLEKFNTSNGTLPRGGVMGWPLVLFGTFRSDTDNIYGTSYSNRLSKYFQAHFGAGYAEPYTSHPSVVVTPSCIQPDHSSLHTGYQVLIKSKDPSTTCNIIQGNHSNDIETLAQGVFAVTDLFQNHLVSKGIIGKQIEPSFEINVANKDKVIDWIRQNHFTVYHWACTTQSGIHGKVADEHFRIRNNKKTISNLRVGSAAALPELSEANPHLTITAFAIALAEDIAKAVSSNNSTPIEIIKAREEVETNGKISIRRQGEERPSLANHARLHYQKYHQINNESPNSNN